MVIQRLAALRSVPLGIVLFLLAIGIVLGSPSTESRFIYTDF